MKQMKMRRAAYVGVRKGFTLIELLLVLVIIAVLAAVVVPKMVGRTEDAKIKATIGSIAGIKSALETFEVDNGRFPSSSEGLDALIVAPNGMTNWHGPYVDASHLKADAWNHKFVYRYPGTQHPEAFDLLSTGPDGQESGDDISY